MAKDANVGKRAWTLSNVLIVLTVLATACGSVVEPTSTPPTPSSAASEPDAAPAVNTPVPDVTATPAPIETGIIFPDPDMELIIRVALGQMEGPITEADLATLTGLDASSSGIVAAHNTLIGPSTFDDLAVTDLSGLEHLTNLTMFSLDGYDRIRDLSPLSNLTGLVTLNIRANLITDLSALSSLTRLTNLTIQANNVIDLSHLSNLTNLTRFDISRSGISDLSFLADLTKLTELRLSGNQIDDLSPLANLTNVTVLWLGESQIVDISALSNMTSLATLRLEFNQINDLSPLVENEGLGKGDSIKLSYNDLDLEEGSEDMEHIRALESRGVQVEY